MEVTISSSSILEEENRTTSLQQPENPVIIKTYAWLMSWRQKSRPTNKLHLNMKKILNPKWQKEKLIEIDEFTSEQESKSKKFEGMISKALENVEEIIKSIPDIAMDKGK